VDEYAICSPADVAVCVNTLGINISAVRARPLIIPDNNRSAFPIPDNPGGGLLVLCGANRYTRRPPAEITETVNPLGINVARIRPEIAPADDCSAGSITADNRSLLFLRGGADRIIDSAII
jgi:hypothetical protein